MICPIPLLPAVHLLSLILAVLVPAAAPGQCYIDPVTGQRICLRPTNSCPSSDAPASNIDPSAHCRISVGTGVLGSGVLVGSDQSTGLVLTCAHLFDDGQSQVIVGFPHAGRFSARLVDLDRPNDLAALEIQRPGVAPLAVDAAEPSGLLTACGFGSNGIFRSINGRITGQATASGATYASTAIRGSVRAGDSGGAVLNAVGQVVGIVWGQRDGQTYAMCGRPVHDFLERVRAKPRSDPSASRKPADSQPPASREAPAPGPPSPEFDWKTWTSELEARVRALDTKKQDKGDYLQHGDLNGYLRSDDAARLTGPLASRTELDSKLGDLATRFDSVRAVAESVQQRIETLKTDRTGFLQGASLGKVAAGALGLSGPMAAGIIIAGGLVGRRVKSRLGRIESHLSLPTRVRQLSTLDHHIAVDSPPPPQRSVPETHYVPVEKDSFSKAHQWASEHVARKYPGATEVLQAQDSLIKQFLAGS